MLHQGQVLLDERDHSVGEEQRLRAVDQDPLAVGGVGSPVRQQVEQSAGVEGPADRCGQSEPQIRRSGRVATRARPSGAVVDSGFFFAIR